jgi:cytochrome c oxidase subunit 2
LQAAVLTGSRISWQTLAKASAVVAASALLASCAGIQSTFSAFGTEAESTRTLTITMVAAAAVITIAVLALAFHAVRAPENRLDHRGGMRVILWLGAIGPTVILATLLAWELPTMRTLKAEAGDLEVHVEGKQFWWRVRYQPAQGEPVESANEIRLPVGRTVTFSLTSPDVIHSFWIPGLAGKMDMIPGRTNRLVVQATSAGRYRGVCAEFCGLSHAAMAFDVVAMEAAEFDRWLVEQSAPIASVTSVTPVTSVTSVPSVTEVGSASSAGRQLFEQYGCGGCHQVRGGADGSPIGPDLTHFGSRGSLAAGSLPMETSAVAAFVRNAPQSKPGVLMPSFPDMSDEDATAIAGWLMELR